MRGNPPLTESEPAAQLRVAEIQPLFGPRDTHVEKPSLLLQFRLAFQRTRVRQEAFFDADQEHDRKLEPFCSVEREQRHLIATEFRFVDAGHQRCLFEEALQPFLGRQLVVAFEHAAELYHVFPALALGWIARLTIARRDSSALQCEVEDTAQRLRDERAPQPYQLTPHLAQALGRLGREVRRRDVQLLGQGWQCLGR
ncbi:hypothetical protein HRbin27_01050 [bacterium HR27]|nr:hypothetical protein HRbin27_01050 [bacterium HR27]